MTRRRFALPVLVGALLWLAPVSGAAAYTFTQVTGSPFPGGCGAFFTCAHQVVFSPRGNLLLDTSDNGVYEETVFKSGAVGRQRWVASPDACKPHHGVPINTGRIDEVAFSANGALVAEVEEPGAGQPTGTLRIFRVHRARLLSDSCRALPYVASFFGFAGPPYYYSVAFGPGGALAVTNRGKDTVSLFSVTAAGKTYPVSGSPFATGNGPDAVAFGPAGSGGEALAVANRGDNNVSSWSDSAGVFPPAPGSPFAALAAPAWLAFSPTGDLLAVADSGGKEVNVYAVDFFGALTGVAAAHTGDTPTSVAFSGDGSLLATAASAGGKVSVFSVAANGQLAQVSGSPLVIGDPLSVAFDAKAALLAVATGGKTSVYSYK